MVENQKGCKIKCLQSDNGGEYISNEFNDFLEQCVIKRRLTIANTLQQNGIAERINRTYLDIARCMLIESRLPEKFWAEAISTAYYIRNRCPINALHGEIPRKKFGLESALL